MTYSATREDVEEYRLKLIEYIKDERSVKATKISLHNVVWGQCSHMLRTKLRGDDDFINIGKDGDVVELLQKIRGVYRQMTTNSSICDSIDEAKKHYYLYRQQLEDDNETHLRTFKNNSEVVLHYKGNMYEAQALIEHEKKEAGRDGVLRTDTEFKALVRERIMGTALLKRSDMSIYGPLVTDIREQFGYGINVYPKSLTAAYDILEDSARSRILYPIPRKKKPKTAIIEIKRKEENSVKVKKRVWCTNKRNWYRVQMKKFMPRLNTTGVTSLDTICPTVLNQKEIRT